MSLVPRNASCPCGSGRKYKKCCLDREPELRRRTEAVEALVTLPTLFLRLRPTDSEFEEWASQHEGDSRTRDLIEDGLARIPPDECDRIVATYPGSWARLVADIGDERDARGFLLVGALTAALAEAREPCSHCVALLEAKPQRDPAEALASLLDPWDLWSITEAALAEDEANPAALAGRLWSDDHERRLRFLVDRLAPKLGSGRTAKAAVERFRRSGRVRRKVAALLLEETRDPLHLLRLVA